MHLHIFLILLLIPAVMGALSSWMRYKGYNLAGHTRKEELAMPTVEHCWKACLQETNFSCKSVAYAEVGSQSCLLYDKKALSVYRDWTSSPDFTYYEYCVNGTWTWTLYINGVFYDQTLPGMVVLDVQGCLEACRAEPTCVSVDYRVNDRSCWRNDVAVLDDVTQFGTVPDYDFYSRCKQVSYGMVYIPVSAVKGTPHNRFQRGVLHTTDTTDVNTLEVYPKFRCPLLCYDDSRCLGFTFGTTSKPGVTLCYMIVQL